MANRSSSHRRYNPLADEWVLCSPGRLKRPWQGLSEVAPVDPPPPYDPDCYLCPGNLRANGERNPAYTGTLAFDNDFPALASPLGTTGRGALVEGEDGGLLRSHPEAGHCRVLCFSPRHDLTLALMEDSDLRAVIDAWADEVTKLQASERIRHVQIFENKGEPMGCSNPHPHGQIWATEHVPSGAARRQAAQRRYFDAHGRDLLGDYLSSELRDGERIVLRNDDWVVLVPFWAVWPFETMVLPTRLVSDLASLEPGERNSLSDVLGQLNRRYDNLFHCSFPYSMAWHVQPADDEARPYWRLHAGFLPPLLRSATVRKFVVGYELSAEPQRDFLPEEAAERLRAMPEAHYLRREASAVDGGS